MTLVAEYDFDVTADPKPWVCSSPRHTHPRRTSRPCRYGEFEPRPDYDPNSAVARAFAADAARQERESERSDG